MSEDLPPSGRGPGDAPRSSGGGEDGPHILSRRDLQQQARRQRGHSRARWYWAGGVALVIIGAAIAVAVVHARKPAEANPTTTVAATPSVLCPLTGTPAPGGTVPARAALGVKIGNFTGDRPSAGLNQADLVFEEPVEGAITRLVAVFQCHSASLVGDLRSARQPDAGILSQLSNPVFAHAGGIAPVLSLLNSAPLIDKNVLMLSGSTIIHPSGRYAPYSTFSSTAALWTLAPSATTPPAPIFQYSAGLPTGAVPGAGLSVHIPFSASSDVTWQWSVPAGAYLRSYGGVPDRLLDGSQTATVNVVVMTVQTSTGSWVENDQGGREVVVTATGSGPLLVLRGGATISGTWSRTSLTQPASLTGPDGAPITLQPGNTWIELVPAGIPVTPAGAPAAPAASGASPGASTK